MFKRKVKSSVSSPAWSLGYHESNSSRHKTMGNDIPRTMKAVTEFLDHQLEIAIRCISWRSFSTWIGTLLEPGQMGYLALKGSSC